MNINRVVHTFGLTGLAILALTSRPAAADTDDKSYPGALCHEKIAIESSAVVRGADGFFNFGTGLVEAECPIVKDDFTLHTGTLGNDFRLPRISSASVRVANRSSTGNIACVLSIRNDDGTHYSSQTRATTTNTGVETLTFTRLGGDVRGYYDLSCTLPPNGPGGASRIISYRVNEEV